MRSHQPVQFRISVVTVLQNLTGSLAIESNKVSDLSLQLNVNSRATVRTDVHVEEN